MERRSFLKEAGLGAGALTVVGMGQGGLGQAEEPPPRVVPTVIVSKDKTGTTAKVMELLAGGADALDAVIAGVNLVEEDPNDITVGSAYFLQTLKKIDDRAGAIDPSTPPIYNLIPRTEHPSLKTDGSMVIDRRAVLFWEKLAEYSEAVRTLNKNR